MTTPYVDPQTIHNPAAGGKPPATWGDTVRDDLVSLAKPPMVKVSRSSTQSISNATLTAVLFDAEAWDTDAFHSTSSNTSRITIPTGFGGRYLLMGNVPWDSNTTGRRRLAVVASGVATLADVVQPAADGYGRQSIAVEAPLAAGDYVELWVSQESGASRNVDPTGTSCWFSARLVSW